MLFRLLFASLSLVSLLVAQNPTATMVGTVQRPVRRGDCRKAATNLRGEFTDPDLAPGPYEVTITHAGLRTVRQTDIVLEMDQVARLDFKLDVGEASQAIEVVETGAPRCL
jgi:hypothetical protein